MKKITKIMPIILLIWIYFILFLIYKEILFNNEYKMVFPTVIIISIILNILTIYSALIEKTHYKSLAIYNMILKILTIPFYVLMFLLVMSSLLILSITGIGLFFFPLVAIIFFAIDFFLLVTTSSLGLAAIRIIKKDGILPKSTCALLQICHFMFVIDIIASIILYIKIRKRKSYTPKNDSTSQLYEQEN